MFCRKCGTKRPVASTPQEGEGEQSGEGAIPSEKLKSIVDNVVGALKATAGQSRRATAVQPAPKAPPLVSKPPVAPRLPGESEMFLPGAGNNLPLQFKPEQPRQRSRSGGRERPRSRSGNRERRERPRSRSGQRERPRSRSRDRRPSPRPARRRSGSRRRSRSRRRRNVSSGGGFSSNAPCPAGAEDPSILPTGFTTESAAKKSNFGDASSAVAMPNTREMLGRKVYRMPDSYIRSLLGKGGETIQRILSKTGAAIRVDHKPGNPEGLVTIANNIDQALVMIKEILQQRGCPWVEEETMDAHGKVIQVGWRGQVSDEDVQVPTELVGLFIGNGGDSVQEIKNQVGGALTVKILPEILPGGFQVIQVVGDNWQMGRELCRQRVKDIMQSTSGRWHQPGFSKTNPCINTNGIAYSGYMPGIRATPTSNLEPGGPTGGPL